MRAHCARANLSVSGPVDGAHMEKVVVRQDDVATRQALQLPRRDAILRAGGEGCVRRLSEIEDLGGGLCVLPPRGEPVGERVAHDAVPATSGEAPFFLPRDRLGALAPGPMARDRSAAAALAERTRWLSENVMPHEPWLRRWLQRRGVEQDVEDIVQESYILLIQAERVDHVRHPRNYFCQTARSIILRRARRAAIVRIDCADTTELREIAAEQPAIDQCVAAREELRLVLAAIDRLPPRTRDVFRMRRVEDLSLSATAARLGISQSAVEKHLRAALRLLGQACGRLPA